MIMVVVVVEMGAEVESGRRTEWSDESSLGADTTTKRNKGAGPALEGAKVDSELQRC